MANKSRSSAGKSQGGTNKNQETLNESSTAKRTSSIGRQDSESSIKGSSRTSNGRQSKAEGSKTLDHLFETGLKDIYSAETQLVEALPLIAKAVENEELQGAFMDHLEATKKHVERLEKVAGRLGINLQGETCAAMQGLIEEGQKVIDEFEESAVRDSALIIGAQKIEHYEIAAYGSLCELADVLGHHKIHDILGRTLDEEESTDLLLTDIARDVNDEAFETNERERSIAQY
jgi:ferritin-like metal-binding protein YciE